MLKAYGRLFPTRQMALLDFLLSTYKPAAPGKMDNRCQQSVKCRPERVGNRCARAGRIRTGPGLKGLCGSEWLWGPEARFAKVPAAFRIRGPPRRLALLLLVAVTVRLSPFHARGVLLACAVQLLLRLARTCNRQSASAAL